MSGIRIAAPAFPWLSRFPELNVAHLRDHGDTPGVYFVSLEPEAFPQLGRPDVLHTCPTLRSRVREANDLGGIHYFSKRSDPKGQSFGGPLSAVGDGNIDPKDSVKHLAYRALPSHTTKPALSLPRDLNHQPWPRRCRADSKQYSRPRGRELLPKTAPLLPLRPTPRRAIWPPAAAPNRAPCIIRLLIRTLASHSIEKP